MSIDNRNQFIMDAPEEGDDAEEDKEQGIMDENLYSHYVNAA